ncbi:fasciclin domain-containing protein [Sphingobacterium sp. N143]|uniref:fasciclin domain-containing protein n=1 Tax=Sphingobacterium sp. N143 TaxID=2746727 RepID=UPI0025781C27|nr:fasciclin domain-containing protein [Sphingobacterium sp. N143]MDM1295405.1 fasciclin domain-containing protein [Sphingobacterium sp. N143]
MKRLKDIGYVIAVVVLLYGMGSCKKDEYYKDGGLAQAKFDGSIMDYLDSKPREFDSIAQIIRLAGLEGDFKTKEFTFFAPRDENVKSLIGLARGNAQHAASGVNAELYVLGRDTIKTLADVDSIIWRKYLLRYMFNGKRKLMDYPQIDFDLLNVYKGQNYTSLGNTVSNIGVVYNDAINDADKNNVTRLKYMGYRQLYISYILDISRPTEWISCPVASSDIQPDNGVVHVIDYTKAQFGYSLFEIENDILESKR